MAWHKAHPVIAAARCWSFQVWFIYQYQQARSRQKRAITAVAIMLPIECFFGKDKTTAMSLAECSVIWSGCVCTLVMLWLQEPSRMQNKLT